VSTPTPSFSEVFGRVVELLGSSFIIVIILNVLDRVTSIIGYSRGYGEGNPITRILTDRFGDYVGISIEKVIIIAFMLGVYYLSRPRWRRGNPILATLVLAGLTFAVVGYAVVVGINLTLLGL